MGKGLAERPVSQVREASVDFSGRFFFNFRVGGGATFDFFFGENSKLLKLFVALSRSQKHKTRCFSQVKHRGDLKTSS